MVNENWVIHAGSLPIWVRPVFKRDVREISGCADVIYDYVNEYEIKPYNDTEIFKNAIRIIHDHGLKVVVSLGTGDRFSCLNPCTWHLTRPETWIRPPPDARVRERRSGKMCCINNPDFIAYTKEFYMNLFDKYDVDGIAFDEPYEVPCICKHCKEKFKKVKGKEMSGKADKENLDFQAESLVEYISLLSDLAKEKELTTACIVLSRPEAPFHAMLAQVKNLDILGPDPYWIYNKDIAWVGEMTRKYREICDKGSKLLMVVIQGFHIPFGRENEIYEAGKIAAGNGADILCGWFHWRHTDNPELAWDTTYRMLIDFGRKKRLKN